MSNDKTVGTEAKRMSDCQNANDNIEIKIPKKCMEELTKNTADTGCGCGCLFYCVINVAT